MDLPIRIRARLAVLALGERVGCHVHIEPAVILHSERIGSEIVAHERVCPARCLSHSRLCVALLLRRYRYVVYVKIIIHVILRGLCFEIELRVGRCVKSVGNGVARLYERPFPLLCRRVCRKLICCLAAAAVCQHYYFVQQRIGALVILHPRAELVRRAGSDLPRQINYRARVWRRSVRYEHGTFPAVHLVG